MAKGEKMSTSNKMEDYEILAKFVSKGEQIPEHLLPLLLDVYQSSVELQNEENGVLIPKEYELTYADKGRKEEILSTTKAAPLQKVRTFNNSNKFTEDWENKLILGDNLKVLKSLSEDPNVRGKINLIYIDPPFATKRDFLKNEEKAYADKVVGSAFIEFTRKRLIIMKELLADNGSIFVHLDSKKGHYIKIILDELFGEHNFKNEIIWSYGAGGNPKNFFPRKHDTIFWYTKGTGVFNSDLPIMKAPYSSSTLEIHYKNIDSEGRRYRIQKVNGREYKTFEDEGKMITDVWTDIGGQNATSPISPEFTGYPTQKPEKLLERIISATTNEGDIVLDAFAGSGTSLAVAEKLNRKWIGIDCGKLSIYTIQSRMLGLHAEIGNKGKVLKHKPFAVFNAGLYDYKAIEAMDFSAYREFILQLFQVRDKKHQVNGVEVDGMIKTRSVLLWKHKDEKNLTISESYLQSLHVALGGKGGSIFYLIAPNSAFSFPEDGKAIGETEYRFLRIPQSIIDELIASNGASLVQPRSAGNINDTVDALAFDFIKTPEVKRSLKVVNPKEEHLLNLGNKMGLIKITKFESKGLGKPSVDNTEELEFLAMVMIDKDYKGKIFNLCEVVFAEKIEDGEVYFDFEGVGPEIMVIYLDVYGNEFREVISSSDFKGSK
jgi:DNA modification methylase